MTDFDRIADRYDETRGGETRGEQYAADVDAHLPVGDGPVLEIGVGTGVVALGLARRGRTVISVDLSLPMLRRARERLGPTVALSDALCLAVGPGVVAHAVSAWVVHTLADPRALFREVARILRPGGHYVVCTTQRADPDDAVGRVMDQTVARAAAVTGSAPRRRLSTAEIVSLAGQAGFTARVHTLGRQWRSSLAQELAHLELGTWPALQGLDAAGLRAVAGPAAGALRALPPEAFLRRATADLLDLRGP